MIDVQVMFSALTVTVILLSATSPARAAYTDRQLREHVRQAVIDHHLYAQPECMEYIITRKAHPGVDKVELREDHDSPGCGGDPRVAHRLFEVYVDRKTGKMASDAADPVDGGLQILK